LHKRLGSKGGGFLVRDLRDFGRNFGSSRCQPAVTLSRQVEDIADDPAGEQPPVSGIVQHIVQ
jgi:hypothetical protein